MDPEQNKEPTQSTGAPEQPETTETKTNSEATNDMSQYRTFAILGYILPFLFFLPLLDEKTKNVPYVRFHANQQLILLIVVFGVYAVHMFALTMLMTLGYFIFQLLQLGILVFAVIGVMNAYSGKMKELPFIGQFKVLK